MGKREREVDNARKLRGIYFIDLDDQDYKEPLKIAMKKIGKTHGQQPCRARGKFIQAPRRWLQSRIMHPKRFPKRDMVV